MTIDESLYLTLTIDRADGTTLYVHAAPLGRDAFDRYWEPLSQVYDDIMTQRRFYSAPKMAARMLRKAAMNLGMWEGPMGVERGLMGELRRLTNVIAPGAATNGHDRGWDMIPLTDALRDGLVDREDAEAIDSLQVFFTAVWHTAARSTRSEMASMGAAQLSAETSPLSLSAYAASLPTSTATDSIGVTHQEVSSPPFSTGSPMPGSNPSSMTAPPSFPGAPPLNSAIAT